LAFSAAIVLPETPVKEGYTFGGWSEVPATMPSCDIEIHGTYIPDEGAEMTLDGHGYVDLGLPSKKLWATCNYGAGSVEDYGAYLDWSDADVVKTEWGSNWKTPSYSDVKELVTKCTWTEETVNGVFKGYKVTGPNGNTMYLPKLYEFRFWTDTAYEIYGTHMAYVLCRKNTTVDYQISYNTEFVQAHIRPVSTITSDDLASGIETPLVDNHSLVNVYSLQGVMIKSQVPVSTLEEELSSGIYIINGKKFMVK
jgi:hypothetical protein